jgi:hypothetical protein
MYYINNTKPATCWEWHLGNAHRYLVVVGIIHLTNTCLFVSRKKNEILCKIKIAVKLPLESEILN